MKKALSWFRQRCKDFFCYGGWVDALEWILILVIITIRLLAVAAVAWWATQMLEAIR